MRGEEIIKHICEYASLAFDLGAASVSGVSSQSFCDLEAKYDESADRGFKAITELVAERDKLRAAVLHVYRRIGLARDYCGHCRQYENDKAEISHARDCIVRSIEKHAPECVAGE